MLSYQSANKLPVDYLFVSILQIGDAMIVSFLKTYLRV